MRKREEGGWDRKREGGKMGEEKGEYSVDRIEQYN
jgi:hypothetical protein